MNESRRNDMGALTEVQEQPLSIGEVKSRVNTIQHILLEVMKEGVHYGVIPGTQKPSLFKAGAEKIMVSFRLCAEPEVEDLCTPDEIRYRVRTRITAANGSTVGWGLGEASSNEQKFRWRKALCEAEWNDTPEDRRRKKWKLGKWKAGRKGDPFQELEVRTEPADLANSVLKFADKRALVGGIRTTTGASDIFDQDLEDMDNLPTNATPAREPIQQPRSTAPAQAQGGADGAPSTPSPAASSPPVEGTVLITVPQSKLIYAKLHQAGITLDEFCKEFGIEKVPQLPRDLINGALEWIQGMTPVAGAVPPPAE